MCLSVITEKYDRPSEAIFDGWKTFTTYDDGLHFATMHFKGSSRVPLDQWLVAEETEIPTSAPTNQRYRTGFHVYQEEKAKKNDRMRRVYIRKVHTKGTQDDRVVLVAAEMYVPSNPDAWPPKDGEPHKKTLKERIIGKGGNA